MQSIYRACSQLAIAQVAFGANVAVSKKLAEFWPATSIVSTRFLMAYLLLALYMKWTQKPILVKNDSSPQKLTKNDWGLILGQALLGGVLFNAFFQAGLAHVTACCAGILTSAFPMIMAITAFALLGERINKSALLGILLTMCGIVTIHLGSDGELSSEDISIIGTLLILCALIPEALAAILVKKQTGRFTSFGAATLVNGLGAISVFPLLIYDIYNNLLDMSLEAWGLIMIVSLCTVVFYTCWMTGLEVVEASTAGIFVGIMPLSSALFGSIFIGESPSLNELFAGLFILASIAAASRGARQRDTTSSKKPILAAA